MSAMSDHIEQFINELLDKEDGAELKRNELAQYFGWRALPRSTMF